MLARDAEIFLHPFWYDVYAGRPGEREGVEKPGRTEYGGADDEYCSAGNDLEGDL